VPRGATFRASRGLLPFLYGVLRGSLQVCSDGIMHRSAWKGFLRSQRQGAEPHATRNVMARPVTLLWAILFPCPPHCRLLPPGEIAARRVGAIFRPCASDTLPSLADEFASRAHVLLVHYSEAGLGCVLVAADHGRYRTSMRSFPGRLWHTRTGCHPMGFLASSEALFSAECVERFSANLA